jgi:Photoprotection regulator fluorescence recovery protein
MSSTQRPGAAPIREWKWLPAEKTAARKAFDRALSRELEAVVREAKNRAATIGEASELWELERWLVERRREIDGTFDFRYSVLPIVFANLLRDGRLAEEDLSGLAPDKLDAIRRIARS